MSAATTVPTLLTSGHVERAVGPRFSELLRIVDRLVVGDPFDEAADVGPQPAG